MISAAAGDERAGEVLEAARHVHLRAADAIVDVEVWRRYLEQSSAG